MMLKTIHKNRVSRKGSVLILYLLFCFSVFGLLYSVGRLAGLGATRDQVQNILDAVHVSVVAVRADALEQLSEKANELTNLVESADAGGIVVHSDDWAEVEDQAQEIKKAIPGYKGRITSSLRVVMDSNKADMNNLQVVDNSAIQLGIVAEGAVVKDQLGEHRFVPSIWLRQNWTDDQYSHLQFQYFKEDKLIARHSLTGLQWNGQGEDHGYPKKWADVIDSGQFRPYNHPTYRPLLKEEQ